MSLARQGRSIFPLLLRGQEREQVPDGEPSGDAMDLSVFFGKQDRRGASVSLGDDPELFACFGLIDR